MKKYIVLASVLLGCNNSDISTQTRIDKMAAELCSLEVRNQRALDRAIRLKDSLCAADTNMCGSYTQDIKKEYVLTVRIKQESMSFDIMDHIADAANRIDISIPTSKEFYDRVNVGDDLGDGFKYGSFIVRGKISKMRIKVISKDVN